MNATTSEACSAPAGSPARAAHYVKIGTYFAHAPYGITIIVDDKNRNVRTYAREGLQYTFPA